MIRQIIENTDWDAVINLRHYLHAHPELSGQEKNTKKVLMDFISSHSGLIPEDHGDFFTICFEPSEATERPIAFRADMDALPMPESIDLPYASKGNCAHKCGHDGHSASLAAFATMLEKDPDIKRKVFLVFQHAEETGRGGRVCADYLKEKNISEIYAFHNLSGYPENSVMVRSDLSQPASKGLTIAFEGVRSHAGTPENGRNPAMALASMEMLSQKLLKSHKEEGIYLLTTVGMNTGGSDFGISPGYGTISFTLRTGREEDLAGMERALRKKALELSKEYNLKVSFKEDDPFPATINNPEAAEKVRTACRELGISLSPMPEPWRPSEDFGYYLKVMKGAIFYVGNGDYPAPHDPSYDFNDRIIKTAPSIFLKLAESRSI